MDPARAPEDVGVQQVKVEVLRPPVIHQLPLYLVRNASRYPGVESWARKVVLESGGSRRSSFGVVERGRVVALAVTKNGRSAKLCHLSVEPGRRCRGIGSALLRAAVSSMLAAGAEEVRLTMSEDVEQKFGGFFHGFGFRPRSREAGRYRHGEVEVVWAADRRSLHHPTMLTRRQIIDRLLEVRETFESHLLPEKRIALATEQLAALGRELHLEAEFEEKGPAPWRSLLSEVRRTYVFPGGEKVVIENPLRLNVSASGGHRVLDGAGVSHYVPEGWHHLFWETEPGAEPFAF